MLPLLWLPGAAGACDALPAVKLVKRQEGGQLRLTFHVKGMCGERLGYEQLFHRSGRSGESNIQQSGDLDLVPGSTEETAKVYFFVNGPEHLSASIRLFRGEGLIVERKFEFVVR